MWRGRRTVLLAVAWVVPLAWLAFALSAPSDGTVVSSPTAVLGDGRWGETVTVVSTYGDTPLQEGDVILAIDGRAPADRSNEGDLPGRDTVVTYRVDRPGAAGLAIRQDVDVQLTRYPLASAVAENLESLVLAFGLLLAGSVLLWHRAREPLALATLALGAALALGLSAGPFGMQAVELQYVPRIWPHVVGEVALVLALGSVLVLAVAFPRPPALLAERRAAYLVLLAVPFGAYAAWVLAFALPLSGAARTHALISMTLPAAAVTTAVAAVALATGFWRASTPSERVAVRLLVLALLTAALVILVLDQLPRLFRGEPLVPWEILALVLVPMVIGCWVAAVLGYRLVEIDSTLRRSLLQVVLASLVGAVFLAAASAVNLASGASVGSLVTGGVVALILLPAALLLRRTASRVVYGDRAFPYRVVSELRRLEPAAAPEQALQETLALLSRSLRLSYASIESSGASPDDRFVIALGERRGEPTTVELEVAGQPLGRLEMEVSPMRDPFGPRDRRLLEDIGTQVGALVQALAATRELQRTRQRLIEAREEERRRLRRDLHDGIGPSLATMLMRLEVARDLIARDPAGARQLIGQLTDQTQSDIGEIRRLVEGLRPPALDQLGLVSALRQRADEHNHTAALGSAPSLTWSVVADDLGALPAAVEVAAYRIAVEAVSNAVRHSGGSACVVTLRRDAGALALEIRDDGTGLPDVRRSGVGIGSMRERAEELGGTCTISPVPDRGTLVAVRLPLAADEYPAPMTEE